MGQHFQAQSLTENAPQRCKSVPLGASAPPEPGTVSCPQVCSVLESLEQEYKREEDWCGGADKLGPNSETDHVTPMISKHLEQKEAFLKVRAGFPGGGGLTEQCTQLQERSPEDGTELDYQSELQVPLWARPAGWSLLSTSQLSPLGRVSHQ